MITVSHIDFKKPDMAGWSEYRKAEYNKTQRMLAKRWSNVK